jgi:outer membrane biosynthesis protein TonB
MSELVCKYCGAHQTDGRASTCEKCGAALPVQSNSRNIAQPTRGRGWTLLVVLTLIGVGLLWSKHRSQVAAGNNEAQSEATQTRVVSVVNPIVYTEARDGSANPERSVRQASKMSTGPQASPRPPAVAGEHEKGPVPVNGRVEIPPAVAAKLLVTRVEPVYPAVAKGARVHGTVVLMAVIGKDGHVKTLEYYDGPEMLANSAMAAAFHWVYTPYRYKGEPVEMDTAIAVNFNL